MGETLDSSLQWQEEKNNVRRRKECRRVALGTVIYFVVFMLWFLIKALWEKWVSMACRTLMSCFNS